MNGTSSFALRKDIEEGRFAGTRTAHQSSEHAWLDIALDIVKKHPITIKEGVEYK